jgi:hypothetical protein
MTMSAPRPGCVFGAGSKPLNARPAPQVLSSAVVTPRARQAASVPSRSGNSSVIEPAASSQTSLVLSRSSGTVSGS